MSSSDAEEWAEMHERLVRVVARTSASAVGRAVKVAPSTVSRWISGTSEPTGDPRDRLFEYLEKRQEKLAPASAREPRPPAYAAPERGVLTGRSVEVEALLAYALERQALITQELQRLDRQGAHAPGRDTPRMASGQ